jgi:hypothetical protein
MFSVNYYLRLIKVCDQMQCIKHCVVIYFISILVYLIPADNHFIYVYVN